VSAEGAPASKLAIERLLKPRSVAIVGASATPGALGASVVGNLDRMGYKGEVYLVNPNRSSIGARNCLKSVADLPLGVDVAVLAIPKAGVLPAVKELANRQVGSAIIFSAGFAEGGTAGLAEQHELTRIARDSGMVIEGPNCLGFVNYVDGVALTFAETPAIALGERRGIGILSQSGAMAVVVGTTLNSKNLGISYSVSTGNEAVSGIEHYLEYLIDDPKTSVIALIVEQFRNPKRFIELARRAREQGKPIVLLHPGRSAAARESAATHTGALAGDFAVMSLHVQREGVLIAASLEEFGDLLELSLRCGAFSARGTAVLTESGAFKALTLDICEQIGLRLPELNAQNAPVLRASLPEFVPVSNPVDLTAQALVDPDLYRRTLTALLEDPRFSCIVLAIIQTDEKTALLKFPPIISALQALKPKTPIIFAGLDEGAAVPAEYIEQLRALGTPYFPSPDRAFRAIARLTEAAGRRVQRSKPDPLRFQGSPGPSKVIPEYRAKQLLCAFDIPFPQGVLATSVEQAQAHASALGLPIALKAQSADLSHKSDAGGVVLNLRDASAVAQGWQRLHDNLNKHRPGLELEGVLVEKMSRVGVELIIGGKNDPQWGAVILAGFGGIQAELMHDVRLLTPGMSVEEIIAELYLLKGGQLLRGFRGSPALDVQAAAQIIARIGQLLEGEPSISEIDLNPVMIYPAGEGAVALDALIVMADA
jgi:acetate---CoA ligase (ADP-forming)